MRPPMSGRFWKFLTEIEADHGHSFAEIEAVSARPLRAGVEHQCNAGKLAGTLLEPLHECMSNTRRAPLLIGHQIIDVEVHTDRGVLVHAPHGEAGDEVPF